VRGLTLIVTASDRLRVALEMAAATAALGGRARIFCQGEAVRALVPPLADPRDAAHGAAGLPTLGELTDEAIALGTTLIACQSALALADLKADALDRRVEFGGLVGLIGSLGQDRLVLA
jgi:predicted peroxiredoxin